MINRAVIATYTVVGVGRGGLRSKLRYMVPVTSRWNKECRCCVKIVGFVRVCPSAQDSHPSLYTTKHGGRLPYHEEASDRRLQKMRANAKGGEIHTRKGAEFVELLVRGFHHRTSITDGDVFLFHADYTVKRINGKVDFYILYYASWTCRSGSDTVRAFSGVSEVSTPALDLASGPSLGLQLASWLVFSPRHSANRLSEFFRHSLLLYCIRRFTELSN